jgi:ribosomal RNA-processing protein 7
MFQLFVPKSSALTASTCPSHIMAPIPASKRPTTAGDYSILSLQIPPQQTYTTPSPHFLYVRAHEPKLPDPRSSRSLFIVNTPIDATETHFRTLFADHLGGSRVEQVEFESTGPTTKSAMAKSAQPPSKKRKRTEEDDAAMELPPTWDREIQRSGSAAVVIFVDKPSMEIALKHVKRAAKARTELAYAWAPKGDQVPALGSQRM